MEILAWIILFSLLGSAGLVCGAAIVLLLQEKARNRLVPFLINYAAGTLLGAAFLLMLPNALTRTDALPVFSTVLAGFVGFFLIEKLIIWRHCHEEECDPHGSAGILILFGDAIHNFVDGLVITSSFLFSIELGITVSIALFTHEGPQTIGNFAILLDAGFSRSKAFFLSLLSAMTTPAGAILSYWYLSAANQLVPYFLAVSAASFIYIASADLIPRLHRKTGALMTLRQFITLAAGIGTIVLLLRHHQ